MSATITLTKGHVTVVDDEDLASVGQYRWKAIVTPQGNVYAARLAPRPGTRWRDGQLELIHLHRALLGLSPGRAPIVDHANRDTLDNRRGNLRICSSSLNQVNSRMRGNRTGFKGVFLDPATKRFRAEFVFEGERTRSRRFKTAEEAARAYDEIALRIAGEFACLNFNADGTPGPARTRGEGHPQSLGAIDPQTGAKANFRNVEIHGRAGNSGPRALIGPLNDDRDHRGPEHGSPIEPEG